jgi:hypothetical protein
LDTEKATQKGRGSKEGSLVNDLVHQLLTKNSEEELRLLQGQQQEGEIRGGEKEFKEGSLAHEMLLLHERQQENQRLLHRLGLLSAGGEGGGEGGGLEREREKKSNLALPPSLSFSLSDAKKETEDAGFTERETLFGTKLDNGGSRERPSPIDFVELERETRTERNRERGRLFENAIELHVTAAGIACEQKAFSYLRLGSYFLDQALETRAGSEKETNAALEAITNYQKVYTQIHIHI